MTGSAKATVFIDNDRSSSLNIVSPLTTTPAGTATRTTTL
jgi:hypothetical protein